MIANLDSFLGFFTGFSFVVYLLLAALELFLGWTVLYFHHPYPKRVGFFLESCVEGQ